MSLLKSQLLTQVYFNPKRKKYVKFPPCAQFLSFKSSPQSESKVSLWI